MHDVAEAELLIARALLKRSTAMTNANSQSRWMIDYCFFFTLVLVNIM